MKPHTNITKDSTKGREDRHKKVDKPWQLEYRVVDQHYFDSLKSEYSSFLYRNTEFNKWDKYYFSNKFISVKHCLEQLNKETRMYSSYPWSKNLSIQQLTPFKGKEFRLVNLSTGDIKDIEIGDKEITLKDGVCTSTI